MTREIDPLIALLSDVDDLSDEQVDGELRERGVDATAAAKRLDSFLDQKIAAGKRRRLDVARDARIASVPVDLVSRVRQLALPLNELVKRIVALQPIAEFRDLEKVDRSVLEQMYADLAAIKGLDL